ncbi:MAG: preprotein translocase subunit SecY [Acidobacteria bacterium]|uniref:Protein translocase subunit SecY n=1 Tax=Candidatus Polarisedimenticola svalbardensis TaxID=2886004 RepID=A0A8J6XSE4_9BACT|nr:preprotein translocase subunit SecY [Candidatus Polarisedimenticola svalbardensis]
MMQAFRNILSIPDLRRRVFYTFGLLGVYRIGGHIPTPGIDSQALMELFQRNQGSILGFVDMFSGGNFSKLTIFALGIMPYITASIILQLLTVIWPYLEKLSKEGEAGRKKITQYTRYGTVALSLVQSFGISIWLETGAGSGVVTSPGWGFRLMTMLTLTTGTAFIMWLGEQISERGIGNGISLIIYAGIVVGLPGAIVNTIQDLKTGALSAFTVLLLLILMVGVVAAIVFVERAQRKIPIQYARRVVGRRVYGGAATFLPLRVNTAGVIPVIFASSMLAIPQTLGGIDKLKEWGWLQAILRQLDYSAMFYNVAYAAMIIFFCFFYVSIIFNPVDQADNMKKYGGFIPGIRPGKRTAEYIDRILTRLTFGGALYLAAISLLPMILINGLRVQTLPFIGPSLEGFFPTWITQGLGIKFFFGGTSLLIVVGVAMDTVQQIESQLIMRHYDGFLKGTRLRGRRG